MELKLSEKKITGKRLMLIHIDDQYTKLLPGDEGTAIHWDRGLNKEIVLWVKWDNGETMGLIKDHDQWEWLNAPRV